MDRHARSSIRRGQTYDNDRYGSSARGRGQFYDDGYNSGSDSYAGDESSDAGDSRDDHRRRRRDTRDPIRLPTLACEYGSESDEVPRRGMRNAYEPRRAGRRPSPTSLGHQSETASNDSFETERRRMRLDREVRLGHEEREIDERRYARRQQERRGMNARTSDPIIIHDVPVGNQCQPYMLGIHVFSSRNPLS